MILASKAWHPIVVLLSCWSDNGLAQQGIAISQTLIKNLHQTFGTDGTNHPLFPSVNIEAALYEKLVDIAQRRDEKGDGALTNDEFALLLTVPFAFTAEQFGDLFQDDFTKEIVKIRKSRGASLREQTSAIFTPIDPDNYLPRLTILENALYGRVARTAGCQGRNDRRFSC